MRLRDLISKLGTTNARGALALALAVAGGAAFGPADRAWASAESESAFSSNSNLIINNTRNPVFPAALRREGLLEGQVVFLLHVNERGELADHLLLEATRLEFASEVERVFPFWNFVAHRVNGEPVSIATRLRVRFERSGVVVLETAGFNIPAGFLPLSSDRTEYRVREIRELDAIPEPIYIDKPEFHVDLLDERDLVTAVFEFYIDTEGRVRIPTLRHTDDRIDERLLLIAQESLLQWRFNAPTVRRKPVVTKAAQPFRFRRGVATAAAEAP